MSTCSVEVKKKNDVVEVTASDNVSGTEADLPNPDEGTNMAIDDAKEALTINATTAAAGAAVQQNVGSSAATGAAVVTPGAGCINDPGASAAAVILAAEKPIPALTTAANEVSTTSSTVNKRNSSAVNANTNSSANKRNNSDLLKERQNVELLLTEFCDELEHQLSNLNSSARHHARSQCRLDRRLKTHGGELVMLNGKAHELRQRIAYMKRVRMKNLVMRSTATATTATTTTTGSKGKSKDKETKDKDKDKEADNNTKNSSKETNSKDNGGSKVQEAKGVAEKTVDKVMEKAEKQTLPQIKIRKRALEQLIVRVGERLKFVKTMLSQEAKKPNVVASKVVVVAKEVAKVTPVETTAVAVPLEQEQVAAKKKV